MKLLQTLLLLMTLGSASTTLDSYEHEHWDFEDMSTEYDIDYCNMENE